MESMVSNERKFFEEIDSVFKAKFSIGEECP